VPGCKLDTKQNCYCKSIGWNGRGYYWSWFPVSKSGDFHLFQKLVK
jgi:hypothetical protein